MASADQDEVDQTDACLVGTFLGDFELLSELGRGGMGVVYRARQLSLERQVALKVLNASARGGHRTVARFLRESQAAGRLHHTNIVPVYAQGQSNGTYYYAMELIEGTTLDAAIRNDAGATSLSFNRSASESLGSSPLTPNSTSSSELASTRTSQILQRTRSDYRRIASLMAEVCEGLEHAHALGIIHRDIKPQNLLLGADNRLHITDFGLAKGIDDPHLTLDGELMGTLAYMSPEQTAAADTLVDHRTDIYSLGVTLYEVLTLRRPFEGGTREQLLRRIAESPPSPPRRLDRRIPVDLSTVCLRALEKEPKQRYSSAEGMAVDLRRFAEDRPILTRRTGLFERGVKWGRRHKARAAAMVASGLVVLFGGALAASIASGRRKEMNAGIRRAYDQLVYHDYKAQDLVAGDLDRARSLGADSLPFHLAESIAAIGQHQFVEAIGHLRQILDSDPNHREALYLLAWAHKRNGDLLKAQVALGQAEASGSPQTAPEWFFRGLAVHWSDPAAAAASYRKARETAGTARQFFPQATLQLARAFNQQLYQTRRIDQVAEATTMLRELIDYGIYGSNPHYLLSIAHRLTAEVYAASESVPEENSEEHYRLALGWARKGQALAGAEVEPPLTAEAECLESMGDYEAAIEARSTAIQLAAKDEHRLEGTMYRWRLLYWVGRYDAALGDLSTLAERNPKNIFFSYVYPMLILAEIGRIEEAVALAHEIRSSGPRDAQRLLWSATCLRLLGRPDEADALLAAAGSDLDWTSELLEPPQSESWARSMLGFARHELPLDALLSMAKTSSSPRMLVAEAYFHAGALALSLGDRAAALRSFDESYKCFDTERRYTFHSKLLRVKMRQDVQWPTWVDHKRGS